MPGSGNPAGQDHRLAEMMELTCTKLEFTKSYRLNESQLSVALLLLISESMPRFQRHLDEKFILRPSMEGHCT